jgi:hypothetical protein
MSDQQFTQRSSRSAVSTTMQQQAPLSHHSAPPNGRCSQTSRSGLTCDQDSRVAAHPSASHTKPQCVTHSKRTWKGSCAAYTHSRLCTTLDHVAHHRLAPHQGRHRNGPAAATAETVCSLSSLLLGLLCRRARTALHATFQNTALGWIAARPSFGDACVAAALAAASRARRDATYRLCHRLRVRAVSAARACSQGPRVGRCVARAPFVELKRRSRSLCPAESRGRVAP